MSPEQLIEFLADEMTFFSIADALDNLTNGCRLRMSPQDEMKYSFVWILNEMTFLVTSDDSGVIGKSLGWLTVNSAQILEQMYQTNLVGDWCSLPERIRWQTAFSAEVVRRFAVEAKLQSLRRQQNQDQG